MITQGFEIHIDGNVGADGDELATSERIFAVREERLPVLALRQVASLVEQCVETAERGNEVNRALLADTGHTRHVVAGVAHERKHVHHPGWLNAELVSYRSFVKPRSVLTRIVDTNAVVHQLEKVLVDRDNRYVESCFRRAPRDGSDDVVSLVSRCRDDRHAERFARLVHPADLLGEVIRHRHAVRFVIGHELVPETCGPQDRTTPRCAPDDGRSSVSATS